MKKFYSKPSVMVVKLHRSNLILCTSQINGVYTNLGADSFEWGGAGDENAR
jgi:hypothetical protein